ncbi:class I adenylate-forming enzyme family protein [Thalassobaculum sp.]|uniref:class I adenylate-forming enzyme family protein n=1 Tax=Thalassobaculum sp. TaxID=2022740 RepID=UPI0032ED29C8
MNQGSATPAISRSARSTVASLLLQQLRLNPHRIAVDDGERHLSYTTFVERVRRLAGLLAGRGVGRGDRVAILSENRLEYLETYFAAAWLGAILACQNWRLSGRELAYCLDLVEPKVLLVSARHRPKLVELGREARAITFSPAYEVALSAAEPARVNLLEAVEPEDPLLILYTSGTTGLPKGAVISHRAEIVRNLVIRAEFGIAPEDTFVAWSPLYHMGAAECSIGALMTGGKVIPVNGFDQDRLAEVIATEPLGWLLLMPGMVGAFADELERRGIAPRGVKVCGVMADLVPPADIARITRLLDAPYANTFGATETGCPPCSSNLIPVGVVPIRLSKQQSPFCEVRLVDFGDHEVPDGTAGELSMRGPTLFSGYWRADETNARDFRGGWFHMGDVFVRNPDGTLDFVDRVKYLIKSGGENIYPAEIERVMLADPRVTEAAVVRRSDPKWGEVPVAFVARRDESLTVDDLHRRCRNELAGYKQPKGIHFINHDDFPRSASGKVQRHELEKRLTEFGN